MDIPSCLNEQKFVRRNKSSSGRIFFILFLLSLGLNVQLLFFNDSGGKKSPELAGQNAQLVEPVVLPEKSEPALKEPASQVVVPPVVKIKRSPTPKKVRKIDRVEVKRVSFSTDKNFGGKKIKGMQFKIRNSLNYSMCKALTRKEGCERMSAYIGRIMVWFLDIEKNMRNGDAVHLVYKMLDNEDRFKILKLTYQSGYAGKTFEANYYRKSENDYGAYYDKAGKEIAERIASSTTPIKNYMEITSLPGDSRGRQGGHSGTDFKAKVGTPVYASFEGRVTRVNWNTRVNGYCVELDHPREGVKTLYLHLSKVTAKRGAYVKKGQQIALSGNTGRTSAPHLHYEIKGRGKRKRIYNPFSFKHISTLNRQIPAEEWEKFSRTIHQYNQILKAN